MTTEQDPFDGFQYQIETLRGDLRDQVLELLKHEIGWDRLPEAQQRRIIGRVGSFATTHVGEIARIIAAAGRESYGFMIDSVGLTSKGEMKVVLKSDMDADAWRAAGFARKVEMVLLPDVMGERDTIHKHIQPDEPELFKEDEANTATEGEGPTIDDKPVMDDSPAAAAATAATEAAEPEKKKRGRPKKAQPAAFVEYDESGITDDTYLRIVQAIRNSDEPPKDVLRKLMAHYKIAPAAISEARVWAVMGLNDEPTQEAEPETPSADPDEVPDIPAFLDRRKGKGKKKEEPAADDDAAAAFG